MTSKEIRKAIEKEKTSLSYANQAATLYNYAKEHEERIAKLESLLKKKKDK